MALFDQLKTIANTLREADKIDQYQQILDIQEKLLEMQGKIQELEAENSKLKKDLEIQDNIKFKGDAYWLLDNDKYVGPYCSVCYDDKRKLIHMHKRNNGIVICPACKNMIRE